MLLGFVALGYVAVYALPVLGEAGDRAAGLLMFFVIPSSWVLGPIALLMILLGLFERKGSDPFRDS